MNREDRMEAIEARLQILEDEIAISRLLSSYGPAVDSGKSGPTADLYAQDGTFDFSALIGGNMHDQASRRLGRRPRAAGPRGP